MFLPLGDYECCRVSILVQGFVYRHRLLSLLGQCLALALLGRVLTVFHSYRLLLVMAGGTSVSQGTLETRAGGSPS